MKYALGIDIGGTKCAVVLGKAVMPENVTDVIVDKASFATAAGGSDAQQTEASIFWVRLLT